MRRRMALLFVLGLGGCSDTPAALGITGPAPPAAMPVRDDSTISNPGIPDSGNGYGPSIGPSPTSGRYFNYN